MGEDPRPVPMFRKTDTLFLAPLPNCRIPNLCLGAGISWVDLGSQCSCFDRAGKDKGPSHRTCWLRVWTLVFAAGVQLGVM